jgi:hypothetical protein
MMKKLIILFLILFNLGIYSLCHTQIKSILDSKYNRFSIGFKVEVYPNTNAIITIFSEDSLNNILLFDSTVSETQELIFIFKSTYEKEKVYYPNNKVYPIPLDKPGIYYINVIYRKKFMLVN